MRLSADERRETVLRAAIAEFATGGHHGTPTGAIARRAGVSQPYLFRLYPTKRALFQAAAVRSFERTAAVYGHAAGQLRGTEALEAMARARDGLLRTGEHLPLMRLQAVAAAASLDDRSFAAVVRRAWCDLWDLVHTRTGATPAEVTAFFAHEALATATAALTRPPPAAPAPR
ncbi:TetR/AcrR family transcriptional regulator [Streptomyces sp. NPDC056773]|uniref:TetR/AcrR family transcriptional regulator n=1 Tax=Streptomyces sp. NPDC056773 TaxID=3345941 RepID=UPI00368B95CD